MTVIDFACGNEQLPQSPPADEQQELGVGLEAAFDIHWTIFNAMRMGRLRESPSALRSALRLAMEAPFGPELLI